MLFGCCLNQAQVRSTAMGLLGAGGRLASFATTFMAGERAFANVCARMRACLLLSLQPASRAAALRACADRGCLLPAACPSLTHSGALMQMLVWSPLLVAAALLAAGSVAIMLLPEMAHKPLDDTIEDAQQGAAAAAAVAAGCEEVVFRASAPGAGGRRGIGSGLDGKGSSCDPMPARTQGSGDAPWTTGRVGGVGGGGAGSAVIELQQQQGVGVLSPLGREGQVGELSTR
jgi:hypothetical protein